MSDWTWEYVPNAASVVGGLAQAQIDAVESLASRIADAVAVRRIGTSFDVREAVSNVKSYGEGPCDDLVCRGLPGRCRPRGASPALRVACSDREELAHGTDRRTSLVP